MGQINTNNYPTVSSLADADLLIVENAIHGTGTTTPKQLRENAIGTDTLETTAQTVTGAINEIFEMASDVVVGLEIGKMTSFSDSVIVTDIDLHRAPVAGDRLLVYFDEKITNPTGLKTYNNGVAVTSNLENATPLYINAGWNILEFKNDGLLYNNVWVRKQNVPVLDTLAGMSDTLIVSPSDDQLLVYDNGMWKNKKFVEANVGFSNTELKKIKVGDIVYDTDGLRDYSVSSIANNNITISVLNSNQFVMENIAINTGNHSGSSNGWNLVLTDGMNPVSVALKNADGSPFADDIHENELLFVYVDTAGNIARVLEIHSHDLEILKDAIITEKTATGNPVTVTDALPYNAVSLSAEIEAIQDLHGYDHPWVGGANINKCPNPAAETKTHNGATVQSYGNGRYKLSGTTTGSATIAFPLGASFNLPAEASSKFIVRCSKRVSFTINFYKDNSRVEYYSISDTRVVNNFPVASVAGAEYNAIWFTFASSVALDNAEVELMIVDNSVSDDVPYSPYSNICPISGRTEVTVNDHGKNVLPNNIVDGTVDGITYTKQSDGSVKINGTSTGRANGLVAEYHLQNGTWIVSKGQANALFGLNVEAYNDNTWVKVLAQSFSTDEVQFTVDNNGYNKIRVSITTESGRTANNLVYYPMIRSASDSDSTYAPFVANVDVTIQLGQTVYGCTLNVTTGVLTPKTTKQTLNSDLTWVRGGGASIPTGRAVYYFTEGLTGAKPCGNDDNSNNITMKSNVYNIANKSYNAMRLETGFALGIGGDNNTSTIGCNVSSTDIPDVTAFETWLDSNPIEIEYPLANLFTIPIQLTPTQLQMLKGYNRVSIDNGTITLTYKADRLAAIEAALAEIGA